MQQYCAARFERGMGFGNRLYPWARCHLYSLQSGVPMLAPMWWWPPRVRPLLKELPPLTELPGHLYVRGIRDLPEYVGGARRTALLATSRGKIRVFRGEAGRFADLTGFESELHAALRRMSTTPLPPPERYIGLHVRRGDFGVATSEQLKVGGALRTPTEWFVNTLRAVRRRVGNVPARVVSDGDAAELLPLLNEPGVSLYRSGAPLGDLLLLAGAAVLLASGSSFSAWAAFLGGMPTATHPGQSVTWFGLHPRDFIGEFDPAHEDASFLEAAARRFNA